MLSNLNEEQNYQAHLYKIKQANFINKTKTNNQAHIVQSCLTPYYISGIFEIWDDFFFLNDFTNLKI
jgi:hypothetical protein